jgi:uncharacterized RDD family membrane protein YckC
MREPVGAEDDLVVSTPERVAFQYPVAGLGSRFVAQLIDLLLMAVLLAILSVGAIGLAYVINDGALAFLIWDLASFCILFGYFIVSEAVWSGQTLGKRTLHLRAVGDQGEPISVSQAVIRNLVRIVDFLPLFYGVGMIALFANGKGKRLGDLAAGTVVVREHDSVRLIDLERQAGLAPGAPAGPTAPAVAMAAPAARSTPLEDWLRRVDPNLRRLAGMYALRRYELIPAARYQLAAAAEPALRKVLPATVNQAGALAALDQLANLELSATLQTPPPPPPLTPQSQPPAPPPPPAPASPPPLQSP